MKLAKILLTENTKITDLKNLTWDLIISIFGEIPSYGLFLPNPDDSSTTVQNERALENWKEGIMRRFGNVQIKIDPQASSFWDNFQVLDDDFKAAKARYTGGKSDWLEKQRQAGKTSGLD